MGLFTSLLPVAGAAAGGFLGGPTGAIIGGGLGSGIGGTLDNRANNKNIRKTQNESQAYLNNINNVGKQYLEPYINPGVEAGNRANSEYSNLLDDPSGFINAIMSSYKPSEGYQFKENHLRRGAANTAAAGGFAGTQFDNENQSALINALLSDDMQQYLTNVLGAHGTGLAGKEVVAGRGFNSANNLADYIGSNLGQQSGLAYNAGNNRNSNNANFNNSLLSLGSGLAGTVGNQYWPTVPNSAAGIGGGRAPVRNMGGGGSGVISNYGPVKGGYGGPYQSTVPGAAWMRL